MTMRNVDMSAKAVAARLKRLSQLRRLGLSLQKARIVNSSDRKKEPSEQDIKAAQEATERK
jgi:hypothetical protein